MKVYLQSLFQGQSLTEELAEKAMDLIMEGQVAPELIAAFLGALAGRGETVAELVGCARSLRRHAIPFPAQRSDLLDVCGTGGDGQGTFNISTANAILLSACGLAVVKHGNRAISSQCGSADVLEALGLNVSAPPSECMAQLEATGFTFLFAPQFHPAMKHVAPVRKALGVRTIFNLLGPLVNPASVSYQIVGVSAEKYLQPIAECLARLGSKKALVVWAEDGMDEVSLNGPTHVRLVSDGRISSSILRADDFGLQSGSAQELLGGDKLRNAAIIEEIFQGAQGSPRDIVLMNAGVALVMMGKVEDWRRGAAFAADVIDRGAAWQQLERLRGKL